MLLGYFNMTSYMVAADGTKLTKAPFLENRVSQMICCRAGYCTFVNVWRPMSYDDRMGRQAINERRCRFSNFLCRGWPISPVILVIILASILCTISITTNNSDFTRYKLAMYFILLAYAMCPHI
ncbi:hypothetical protein BDV09DRAFT_170327, partial [Aspergillus tetrazonus]